MKRLTTSLLLLLFISLSPLLIQCGKSDRQTKVIAIATLMAHPALDAVQENTIAELKRQGYIDGQNVRYVIRNANGDVKLASNIATELSALNPDLIVAITTPMAQAVAKAARCPVVFGAVTDPVGAGIVTSLEKGEGTITGTSDAWPYLDQLKLIHQITPSVKTLGVLYNPGEAASQYGVKKIRSLAPDLGLSLVEGAANSTSDVFPVAQNLAGRVDALFLSSDNTVIGGMAGALKVAVEHKIPLYVGDSGTVEKGGLAAVSVGYAQLGTETGKLAARMLRGERNIPTFVAEGNEIYLNTKAAELMRVTIPAEVLRHSTKIFNEIAR